MGQLRRQLLASGELIVKQSRGRRPNVYVIPYESCHLCQAAIPDRPSRGDDVNPKVEFGVAVPTPTPNPQRTPKQPPSNPQVTEASGPELAPVEPKKDVKGERENNVNVEIDQPNPKRPTPLTLAEEDLVEELVRRFRDEKSRATYRIIVGKLGVAISYPIMLNVWEVRQAIAVSPGAYFVGIAKNIARENGIELGLRSSLAGP